MTSPSVVWRARALASALCFLLSASAYAQEAEEDQDETNEADDVAETSESESALDKKRSSARQLATDASNDYRMGRFQDAYDSFNRAFKLVGVPALGVWSARSLRQLNRLVEASERYREVLKAGAAPDAPESHRAALADAQAELDELLPLIPNLTIQLENAKAEDVEVTMDGEPVDPALVGAKQRVNPGKHSIRATRGDEVVEKEIDLPERATQQIVLPFKAGYNAAPKGATTGSTTVVQQGFTPRQTIGIVAMSGAGALLITGVVTTVMGLGQQEKLRKDCPGGACEPEYHSDVNKFNTMKVVSTATLIGGGVLGGIGAALYFGGSSKKESEEADVALYMHGSELGLMGNF